MGMYDIIRTNYRLPNIEVSEDLTLVFNSGNTRHFGYETEFQTKDFENLLDQYLITSHGILLIKEGLSNVETNYTGNLSFVATVPHPANGGYYIEYHSSWLDGRIASIGGECIKATAKLFPK
jgi:hypothetical protein